MTQEPHVHFLISSPRRRQPVRFHTFTAASECVANAEPLKPRRTIKAMSGGSKITGKLCVLCGNPTEMRRFPAMGKTTSTLAELAKKRTQTRRLVKRQPAPLYFLSLIYSSITLPRPSISASSSPSLTPSSSQPPPPPPPPHRTKIMDHTQRELFIEQDSRGSSSPHRASLHSHQTPPMHV